MSSEILVQCGYSPELINLLGNVFISLLIQAICCPDGEHCCPHGSVCDMVHHSCKPTKSNEIPEIKESSHTLHLVSASAPARINPNVNPSKADWRKKIHKLSAKYLLAYSGVVCPDPLYECPADTTCCPSPDETWACCPIPQTVSFPGVYNKDLNKSLEKMYNNKNSSYSVANFNLIYMSLSTLNGTQLCPDAKSRCSDEQTCCKLKSGKWGCCPVKNVSNLLKCLELVGFY
ncbi:unnamed protein product [Schistosoma mattheei]|uniref:Uncharacterized protein n=1 Tax=Schistosoma mattheei TaxID=31246 RepID=A0A183PMA0_9TREM|nr:unnamed protein product [Schistosoma mattheei]